MGFALKLSDGLHKRLKKKRTNKKKMIGFK